MPVDIDALRALAEKVGSFHITDTPTKRVQEEVSSALSNGAPSEQQIDRYLHFVKRYFADFEREAHAHIRSIDKRLEQVNQVRLNLTGERKVAVRRIENIQDVLCGVQAVRGGKTP